MSKTFKELLDQTIKNMPDEIHYDPDLKSTSDVKDLDIPNGHEISSQMNVSSSFRQLVNEAIANQPEQFHVDPELKATTDVYSISIDNGHSI